jgi:DNA-binding NtrC family response regulator
MHLVSQGSGKQILIIDQEPAILSLLEMALSEQGFTVHCASSPEWAIEICKAHPVRIVLADVDFLGGAGLHLLADITTMRPGLPICLMTAGTPPGIGDDLKHLGVTECISKPMDLSDLLAALERQLQE